MLQLALEESKNAALAAAAGRSEDSSEEENSDSDSDDGSSAHGVKTGGGKARRAKPKQKLRTLKPSGAAILCRAPVSSGLMDVPVWRLMHALEAFCKSTCQAFALHRLSER